MQPDRQKIFNVPFVLVALIGVMLAIHALRLFLPVEQNIDVLVHFGFVPGRFTNVFDPGRISAVLDAARGDAVQAEIDRVFLGDGQPLWWTPITYAFLHANWAHVGFNCLWLVAFGAPVARRFGDMRFLLFCLAAAIAGALAHYVTHPADLQPVIGASAIVSATMAAAVRFVFQPGAPLGKSLGWGGPLPDHSTYRQPALSLRAVFADRRALMFLIIWFGSNFLFGVVSGPVNLSGGSIAWQAHIGGFLLGLLAFSVFDRQHPAAED